MPWKKYRLKDLAPPISRIYIYTPNSYIYSAVLYPGEGITHSSFSSNK